LDKTDTTDTSPPSAYVRTAGASYLFVILVGMLSVSLIDSRLIVAGDSAATARNILAHELLFRIGVIAVLAMYAGVVVLSASLFVVLKAVDEGLARIAMLLRISEAILGAATALLSFVALALLTGDTHSSGIAIEHAQDLAALFLDVRGAGLDVVLVFVGLGGTVFCYLFYKSWYVPRPLAAWGIFTYLSMLGLASVSIAFPRHPVALETILYSAGGLFEVVFGLWLLFKPLTHTPTLTKSN
jgi:hypothetical protein